MGRYSDIRRGKELDAALTKLRAWEDKTRVEKQALYKSQRGNLERVKCIRIKGYVESFELVGRIFLPVKILGDTQIANGTLIGMVRDAAETLKRTYKATDAIPAVTPPITMLDGLTGYRPARVSATDRGAVVADNKSRVTEFEYKRYDNKSVSSPFGSQTSGTETYATAVIAIKAVAAIDTFLKTEGSRISFTPEVI
jgi:hypothetical protein